MFCSKCGTQFKDDAKFCKECGTKTSSASGGAAKPLRPARSAPRSQTAFPEESAARTRTVLILVGILVLGAAGMIVWQSGQSESPAADVDPKSGDGVATSGVSEIDRVSSGLDIQGVIVLDKGVTPPSSGTMYIMARPAATPDQRAPLAVDRMTPDPAGTRFVIGPDNIMTGGDFNQPVVLTVRWDQDGDPLTKQIGDLTGASSGPVKPGDKGVQIVVGKALQKAEIHPTLIEGGVPGIPSQAPESAPAEPGEEAASAPADAKAEGATKKITGRITLGDGVTAPKDGSIFVIARSAGQKAGPPSAVARLTPGAQGLSFSLGPENVMMGGPWGGPYDITARWDQDGNAMTKQAGDLSGAAKGPASAGDSVEIVLDTTR